MEDAQNLYNAEWHFFGCFPVHKGTFYGNYTKLNQEDTDANIQTLIIKKEESVKWERCKIKPPS